MILPWLVLSMLKFILISIPAVIFFSLLGVYLYVQVIISYMQCIIVSSAYKNSIKGQNQFQLLKKYQNIAKLSPSPCPSRAVLVLLSASPSGRPADPPE